MRSLASPLHDYLASGRTASCADLWTFTTSTGATLRWTNSDRAIPYGGNTYALGPGIERGKVRWSLSLDVDELAVTIYPRATDTVGSTALSLALRRGDFDGANVMLSRAFGIGATGDITGGVIDGYFTGRVADLEADGLAFRLQISSPMRALDRPFPRNVVQAQCANRLGDSICSVDLSGYRVTGTVTGSVSSANNGFRSTLTQSDNYFTLGRFKWTSGANAGRSQPVRTYGQTNGALTFAQGWPEAVQAGDAFEIFPGCDKRQTTCNSKWANLAHFRGFPYVPDPITTT